MNRFFLLLASLGLCSVSAFAREAEKDTLKRIQLDEVQVIATRAARHTPVAYTNVGKDEIRKQNFGQDIPFLLTMTPSVLTTTDAGAGVGYTGIRIRGTDATRINVTANGIPMNDAESHSIFWVNTPDLASSLQDLQIQRGAGTSTNGAGSFGGSINMRTESSPSLPYAELNGSYGSFNTHKETIKVGTGLFHNRLAFDLRLSNLGSDGYRDRASADLKSYFAQAGYYGDKATVKLITFSGREKTYHAWDGISKEMLDKDRRYNPNGEIQNADGDVIGFYDDQVDVYNQSHYQLLFNYLFNSNWNLNVAFHYTKGKGYYQEYKNRRSLVEYGLQPFVVNGETVKKSNLIRKKNVDSDFGGMVFSMNYFSEKLTASVGGAVNKYANDHDGNVIWIENYIGTLAPDHQYYANTGEKLDANIYARMNYEVVRHLNFYADLQYRHINYKINGVNDKWDWTSTPNRLQPLDVDVTFNFFNPKAGLYWQINDKHNMYASFAVAHKEPTRNNYTDGFFAAEPKAERLFDYELGYAFRSGRFQAGANLYYMDYKNQLVLTGQMNEIGEAVSANVKDSYRMGVELSAGVRITDWLRWDVNATWSRNRIKNYTEYLNDVDEDWNDLYTEAGGISQTADFLKSTPISFSPDFMLNSLIAFNYKGFDASFQSQYVSQQYLNNSGQDDCRLDAYFVSNLSLGYTFKLPATKSVSVGVTVYNIFNEMYESNGYASRYAVYDSADGVKHADSNLQYVSSYAAYYPNAGTNALAHLTFRF